MRAAEAKAAEGEPSPFGPGNPQRPSRRYIFLRFLRYGFLAWGGPVAQIGLMHRELVERDGWIPEEQFRKTLALYQALPGPEAHEMAVYFGVLKGGRVGGLLAGLGFMLPGVVLVTLLAALHVRFAQTVALAALVLYGLKPAVVALVAVAFVRLLRASVTGPGLALVAGGAAAVGVLSPGAGFVLVLAAGGAAALGMHLARAGTTWGRAAALAVPLVVGFAASPAASATGLAALAVLSAKVGLLTFGGAYAAIPFLHEGAVVEHGWITEGQFLDAIALAGIVPGPLVAVGTFVGYLAAGLAGALLATVIIFAPAFGFTLLGHSLFERLVREPRLHAFLVGVTAAVVGLVLASVLALARAAVVDFPSAAITVAAGLALASGRAPIPVVLLASGAIGVALRIAAPG